MWLNNIPTAVVFGKTMIRNQILAMLVLASTVLVAGCGDKAQEPPSATQTASGSSGAVPATGPVPQLTVSADKTHAVQPGDELTVTVEITGFALDGAAIGKANQDGVGHYRVYLNDASGDAFLAESAEKQAKVRIPHDLADGSHELRVVLYNNDRTPLFSAPQGAITLIVYRL